MLSKTIETTLDIARQFMSDSQHVRISKAGIDCFCEGHKDRVLAHGKTIENGRKSPENIADAVLLELLEDSVNYNFWYGKYDIRPNNSSSSNLNRLLREAYEETKCYTPREVYLVDRLIKKLSIERYSNLSRRIAHLKEVLNSMDFVRRIARNVETGNESLADLDNLIMSIPGFADDVFLKRAFLFFIGLNRCYGFYEECISQIPIPADYQIPRALNCQGILTYSQELTSRIRTQELIPEGSRLECEIRSGAILACKEMAENLGVTMSVIDDYLFCTRDDFKDNPFHLTVTTWY